MSFFCRHVALSESTGVDSGHPLEVKIEVDSEAKTLTITDSGTTSVHPILFRIPNVVACHVNLSVVCHS